MLLLFILLELMLVGTWSDASEYSAFYPVQSIQFYSPSDLSKPSSRLETVTLEERPLKLVEATKQHLYLGAVNRLYRVDLSNLSRGPELVAELRSDARSQQRLPQQQQQQQRRIRHLYSLGNDGQQRFLCADTVGCRLFNATPGSQLPWQPADPGDRPSRNPFVDGILMPPFPGDPDRVSLSMNGSYVFVSSFPNLFDTMDIVELLWPGFDRVGRTTADPYTRRNRELWMSKTTRAVALTARGQRLYAVYTEEAFEASNYYGSVNGDEDRSHGAAVKLPTFTRLARACLNDPGIQQPSDPTVRVMTSFFKMRLICRNGNVDYDVLELATDFSHSDGAFYGLFSLQNSPRNGYLAMCRFTLDEAESLIEWSDFIELKRDSLQSPYYAQRLPRREFAKRSHSATPTKCQWTQEETDNLKYSDLYVERMAPLMSRPLIAASLLTFHAVAGGHAVTAVTRVESPPLMTGADGSEGDLLLFGTDKGALIKAFATPVSAHVIEILQLPSPILGSRIDRVTSGRGRLFAVSGAAGAVASVPVSRCHMVSGCAACVAMRDPACSWSAALGACLFNASIAGLKSVSSGFHSGCPSVAPESSAPATTTEPWLEDNPTRVRPPQPPVLSRGGSGSSSGLMPGDSAAAAAAAAAATLSGDATGTGHAVPVATFASILVSLCALGFAIGFLSGYLMRLRSSRNNRSGGGGVGRSRTRQVVIARSDKAASAAASAAACDDGSASVPLRRGRGGGHHVAVSNEYTEPSAAALAAAGRVTSSHSSAASWQSCYAEPEIVAAADDAAPIAGSVDHRDSDWQFI